MKERFCRTIKERLRPSTIEESLALPSKPKCPIKRKLIPGPRVDLVKVDLAKITSYPRISPRMTSPINKIKLMGGHSVIKSYKHKRKRKSVSPVTQPSSKSLLSYLYHRIDLYGGGDSSSVDSDTDSLSSELGGIR